MKNLPLKMVVLCLVFFVLETSCNETSEVIQPADVVWKLNSGPIAYLIEKKEVSSTSSGYTVSTTLDTIIVDPVSSDIVNLHDAGFQQRVRFAPNGRLTPLNPEKTTTYWKYALFQILPPDGEVFEGKAWQVTNPDDAASRASDAIVGQVKIDYKIESVEPLKISYEGKVRFAPSRGLDAILSEFGLNPLFVRPFATQYRPYLKGEATFSKEDGSTQTSEGDIDLFAIFGDGSELNQVSDRIQFRIIQL